MNLRSLIRENEPACGHYSSHRRTAVFVGHYEELLRRTELGVSIVKRTAVFEFEALDPHSAVSVIP